MKRTLRNILLILPALCLISLIFSVRASAAAISSSHWAIDFADYCMNRGIISATRSTFSPDEEYKRWELAKAFTKAEGYIRLTEPKPDSAIYLTGLPIRDISHGLMQTDL